MADEDKESWGETIGKQAVGSAILTAAGAAAGAAYGALKHSGGKGSAAIGAAIGLVGSLGFGKEIYEAVVRKGENKQSFAKRLDSERQSNKERSR